MRTHRSPLAVFRATTISPILMWLAMSPSTEAFMVVSTLDYPGATGTYASSINDNQVVAGYYQASGVWHCFVYQGGNYTSYDVPVANTFQQFTGINNDGDIVGRYSDSGGTYHGFLLSGGIGGTFTTLDAPGYAHTMLFGLNDRQAGGYGGSGPVIVGQAASSDWSTQLGMYLDAGGYHTFQYNSEQCFAGSINNNNRIFGGHYASGWQGLLRDPDGTLTHVAFPGAPITYGYGINDADVLAGSYQVSGTTHGFYRDATGFFTTDVPGATTTDFSDVNNDDWMVGYYVSGGVAHGVLAFIPEPTTASILGAGALLLCSRRRRVTLE